MARLPANMRFRRWVKARESAPARAIYATAMWMRYASFPVIPGLHHALYSLHVGIREGLSNFLRIFWYTPLFQTRLVRPARRLKLDSGLPYMQGIVRMELGEGCRVAGNMNVTGRAGGRDVATLIVGDNVDIGWGANIAVGRRIEIGNNTRLAGGNYLLGYPGHPLDAAARARGEMDTDDQVGDIILEDDVWVGSRSTIIGGVRVGRGTIIAAGSVVTKSLPPFVLAAGNPAVVKRTLEDTE